MKETVLQKNRVWFRSRVATFGLLFLFSTFCAVPSAFAQSSSSDAENDNVVVEVAGMGETAEEARADCWRQALSRVCETYVESKRVVINDELFEKIVSYTEGKIVKTEEISQSREDGAIILTAKVTVSQKQLYQELAASFAVSETGVEISQTPPDGLTRAAAISRLKDAFSVYPACVLKASVRSKRASNLYVPTGETRPLTIADVVTTSDGESYLDFDLVLSVDDAKYKAFVQKIVPLLEKVAENDESNAEKAFVVQAEPSKIVADASTVQGKLARKFFPPSTQAESLPLAVCVNSNAKGTQTRWRKFLLSRETVKKIDFPRSLFLQVKLEFADGEGAVIVEKTVNLESVLSYTSYTTTYAGRRTVFLSTRNRAYLDERTPGFASKITELSCSSPWSEFARTPGIECVHTYDVDDGDPGCAIIYVSNFSLRSSGLERFDLAKREIISVREAIFDDEIAQIESLRATFVPLRVDLGSNWIKRLLE